MMSIPSKLVMYGYPRVIEMVKINYDTITIQMEKSQMVVTKHNAPPF